MSSPITICIIVATVIMSALAFQRRDMFERLLMSPWNVAHRKEYYRMISHAFIHADWMHLAFNMYTFYSFGTFLELIFTREPYFHRMFPELDFWGEKQGEIRFVLLYAAGAVVACIPSLIKHKDNANYRSVGASGAVSAVLMAFMVMFPTWEIQLFYIVPMPAFIGAFVFFGLEHYLSRKGNTNIAHDAHIWGALFGILFVAALNPEFITLFVSHVSRYLADFF